DVIAAELERDPSDRGSRHAAAARAARPHPEAKEQGWNSVVKDPSLPLAVSAEIMGGFQQFGQEGVLAPYAERYFDVLHEVWESRDVPDALAFVERMYPRLIVSQETVDRTDRHLAGGGVP